MLGAGDVGAPAQCQYGNAAGGAGQRIYMAGDGAIFVYGFDLRGGRQLCGTEGQGFEHGKVGAIQCAAQRILTVDQQYFRPAEVDLLVGDSSKAEQKLGWKREVDFPTLVEMMVRHDIDLETKRAK